MGFFSRIKKLFTSDEPQAPEQNAPQVEENSAAAAAADAGTDGGADAAAQTAPEGGESSADAGENAAEAVAEQAESAVTEAVEVTAVEETAKAEDTTDGANVAAEEIAETEKTAKAEETPAEETAAEESSAAADSDATPEEEMPVAEAAEPETTAEAEAEAATEAEADTEADAATEEEAEPEVPAEDKETEDKAEEISEPAPAEDSMTAADEQAAEQQAAAEPEKDVQETAAPEEEKLTDVEPEEVQPTAEQKEEEQPAEEAPVQKAEEKVSGLKSLFRWMRGEAPVQETEEKTASENEPSDSTAAEEKADAQEAASGEDAAIENASTEALPEAENLPSEEADAVQTQEEEAVPVQEQEAETAAVQEAAAATEEKENAVPAPAAVETPHTAENEEEAAMTLKLREAEPRLSAWLAIILEGVDEAGETLWGRLRFLLRSLDAPADEVELFIDDFRQWLEIMEYVKLDEFRSELQYRLALSLNMEDEEDERSRLFLKLQKGLSETRERFARQMNAIFSAHGALSETFWEEMEELFIMADLGYEPSMELVKRLKERARIAGADKPEDIRDLLRDEIEEIFSAPRRITAVNPPEVILMIGVNGVGKTTTIAKLAHRARMQGKKVLIAAADTFRAAAVEQLKVWADRVGADFHSKPTGADPAAVAFEAMDIAVNGKYDILFVDTAGRLQTKTNLMEELTKIRQVLGKKHQGAPHRSILVIDATTGQNALSQTKLFGEAAGIDELILTKLDGTAKGGVAIAVAMRYNLPITFVGLGEKLEDLRPFDGTDFARALLGEKESVIS